MAKPEICSSSKPSGLFQPVDKRGQPRPAAALDTAKKCLGTWGKATGKGNLTVLMNGQEERKMGLKKPSYK